MNENKLNSCRRDAAHRTRTMRRELAERSAASVIGPIVAGMEVFALTSGQFSLIDAIVHALATTGPADVVVSTWTASSYDIEACYQLLRDGRIRNMRFIVDYSFQPRQPAFCAAMRERFGNDSIRISKVHAKFVLITNDQWHLAIRTSQNLNANRRSETLEISDDAPLCAFLQRYVDELFSTQDAARQFDMRPIEHLHQFENLLSPGRAKPDEAAMLQAPDVQTYYSREPYGNDLSRAGLTYLGGRK